MWTMHEGDAQLHAIPAEQDCVFVVFSRLSGHNLPLSLPPGSPVFWKDDLRTSQRKPWPAWRQKVFPKEQNVYVVEQI